MLYSHCDFILFPPVRNDFEGFSVNVSNSVVYVSSHRLCISVCRLVEMFGGVDQFLQKYFATSQL